MGNTAVPCTEELLEGFYFQLEGPLGSTGPETGGSEDGAFGKRKETSLGPPETMQGPQSAKTGQ